MIFLNHFHAVVMLTWTFYCQIKQDEPRAAQLHPAAPSCVNSPLSPSQLSHISAITSMSHVV